jgi:hypothetical protein
MQRPNRSGLLARRNKKSRTLKKMQDGQLLGKSGWKSGFQIRTPANGPQPDKNLQRDKTTYGSDHARLNSLFDERSELSHAGLRMSAANAELRRPTGVGWSECSAYDCLLRSHSNRRCMNVLSFVMRDASAMRRSSPGRMLDL